MKKNIALWEICRVAKFSKPVKFRSVAKLPISCTLFKSPSTVHVSCFLLFTSFGHFFVVSPNCPHCNSICFVILVICKGGLAIKAPKKHSNRIFSIKKVFFLGGNLSAVPASFLFPPLSLIFSHFLGYQTSLEDDNSRDGWLNPLHP